jgi:tRNA threonylcarbamoyladenosine biosynthesis protein TsaB
MTAHILAVDTTGITGSIALLRGGELLGQARLESPDGFAHIIFGELAALLGRCGLAVGEVDCFAAASGPGSFTGVRVGLACVKGMAEAAGKPAVAVSNLQALSTFGQAPLRAAVLDARRGQVYGGVYDAAAQLVAAETVAAWPAWLAGLPSGEIEFVALGREWLAKALCGTRWEGAAIAVAPAELAGAVGRLALERLRRGEACDPAALDANYVRRSDAELFWKE